MVDLGSDVPAARASRCCLLTFIGDALRDAFDTRKVMMALLEIDKLCVNFGPSRVVDHVSFAVDAGEKFALVGESGSGKSVTALSVLRLIETATYEGAIRFEGEDLLGRASARCAAFAAATSR